MNLERKFTVGPKVSGSLKEESDNEGPNLSGKISQPPNDTLEKLKVEDDMIFGSDAWLRHSVELGERQELIPKMKQEIECSDSDDDASLVVSDIESNGDAHEEAEENAEDSVQPIEIKKRKRDVIGAKNHSNEMDNLQERPKGSKTPALNFGLCKFQCTKCTSVTYKCWNGFSKHMRNKHKQSLKMADHPQFLKEAAYHTCRICMQKVLSSSAFLANHLKSTHNLKVKEYKKQLNCKDEVKDKFEIVLQKRQPSKRLKVKDKSEIVLQKGRLSQMFIGNLCTFKCPECSLTHRSTDCFRKHCYQACPLKRGHNSWYKYVVNVVTHKCLICSKSMLCDRSLIRNHLSRNHGCKNLQDYANKTGCVLELSDADKRRSIFQKICKGAKFQERVKNYCRFTCNKCGHVSNSWQSMRLHLNKNGHAVYKRKAWNPQPLWPR